MNIIQSDAWKEHTLQVQYGNAAQGAHHYIFYMNICPCHHFKPGK